MPLPPQTTERIYYDDQTALEFTAEVLEIRELARVEGKPVFQIALDRTAFYPTSGGQPHDTGSLFATARSGAVLEVPITAVEEDSQGEVWHTTAKPLQTGTVVSGRVDAQRRRDHMQQHSGQHLLSAILMREFGAATVSFHLGETSSTVDVTLSSIPEADLERAERIANEVIAAALPVTQRTVTQQHAEQLLAEGKLRKLPPRAGDLRLIQIGDIDLNACGGTHVSSTARIGPLLVRESERVRGNTRVTFVCGDRAIAAARTDWLALSSAGAMLSTHPAEVVHQVERLLSEVRTADKARLRLLAAAASLQAALLVTGLHSATGRDTGSASHVKHTLSDSDPAWDGAYAKLLASRIVTETDAHTACVLVPEGERTSIVLAAKQGVLACGSVLQAALALVGARGGGSPGLAQGSFPAANTPAVLQFLQEEIARLG